MNRRGGKARCAGIESFLQVAILEWSQFRSVDKWNSQSPHCSLYGDEDRDRAEALEYDRSRDQASAGTNRGGDFSRGTADAEDTQHRDGEPAQFLHEPMSPTHHKRQDKGRHKVDKLYDREDIA